MAGEIFGNSDHHEVSGALWVITIGHLGCEQVFNHVLGEPNQLSHPGSADTLGGLSTECRRSKR